MTADVRARVLELTTGGKTSREVAEVTGVSKTAIGAFLRKQRAAEAVAGVAEDVPLEVEASDAMDASVAQEYMRAVTGAASGPPPPKPEPVKVVVDRAQKQAEALLDKLLRDDAPPKPRQKKSVVVDEPAPSSVQMVVTPAPQAPQVDKDTLVAKITLNVNSFEALLGDVVRPDRAAFLAGLPKRSRDDLAGLLKTIELTRTTANLTNYFMQMLFMGSGLVEAGTQQWLGMDTRGYTQALQTQRDELRMIMHELAMENATAFQRVQRPEVRLAVIMTSTLLMVNTQNSLRAVSRGNNGPSAAAGTSANVPDVTTSRYQDL
jgi:hypothetical protein